MVKLALGQILGNVSDEPFWSKNLEKLAPSFDGIVIKVAENCNSYAEARNEVIKMADSFSHILFLDADELMFPEDIQKIRIKLETTEALMLPRYELGPTPEYYNPTLYPDYQGRAFKIGVGYEYRNPIHEILYKKNEEKCVWENVGFVASDDTPIYHYGRCKDPKKIWLRYHNYERIKQGLDRLTEIPEGVDVDVSPNFKDVIKFDRPLP